MRKVFVTGVGGLLLSGFLVTQSWAAAYKSDVVCTFPIESGKVKLTPSGDLKGSITLPQPLQGPFSLTCEILCGTSVEAGPVNCIDGQAGDITLPISAPGLGAALGVSCSLPSVVIGAGACASTYIPPGPEH